MKSQFIKKLLCHDCGSNCDLREVKIGKIKHVLCKECQEEREDED